MAPCSLGGRGKAALKWKPSHLKRLCSDSQLWESFLKGLPLREGL